MKCLVVVEGVSDRGVVQGIAQRLGVEIETLIMRGNNPSKASRIVRAKLFEKSFDKIVILKDLHRYSENLVEALLRRILDSIDHPRKYGIVVKRAIEAWILAGMGIENAENIDDPATYLDELLKRSGRRYVKSFEVAKRLAESIDMDRAAKHSESFRRFVEVVRDP